MRSCSHVVWLLSPWTSVGFALCYQMIELLENISKGVHVHAYIFSCICMKVLLLFSYNIFFYFVGVLMWWDFFSSYIIYTGLAILYYSGFYDTIYNS